MVRRDEGAPSLLECGIIRTRPRDSLPDRLCAIHDGIAELIERHKPDSMAIEDVFYARNVRTTIVLGHARGVVLLCGAKAGLEISEYTPAEIKKAVCGTGTATKDQVQFMVGSLLRLKAPPRPADAADGVAAALAHALSAVTGRKLATAAILQREADTLGALAAALGR